jgi:hypothetical protein
LTIDTTSVMGAFQKKAVVWSNDPVKESVDLYLTGEVTPHVSLEPGGYLSLWGVKGRVPKGNLRIINNHQIPMRIVNVESDLKNHIKWEISDIAPGYDYRLEVEDISQEPADYDGRIYVRTSLPEKPELVILINGRVTEK